MGPQGSRAAVISKENRREPSTWMLFVRELLKTDIYKRSQGRLVRQFTCMAIWVAVVLAAWRIYAILHISPSVPWLVGRLFGASNEAAVLYGSQGLIYGIPTLILLGGLWIGYRIVNLPTFADFLIAVEAELNKVSWPSRTELVRSSMVVIILMFGLTLVLFAYDNILYFLLVDVLKVAAG